MSIPRKASGVFLAVCALAPLRTATAAGVAEKCAELAEEGEDLRAHHRLVAARARFVECAREECPGIVRRDCARWQGEVEQSLPSIVLSARGEHGEDLGDVHVRLDGAPLTDKQDGIAIAIDPGPHVLRFERNGQVPIELRPVIHEGEKNRIISVAWSAAPPLPPPPPPPPPPRPPHHSRNLTLAYGLGGAGLVTLGASAYLEIRGIGDWNHARTTCGIGRTCTPSYVSDLKTELWAGNITFFVGLAAIGGATWVFLSQPAGGDVALQLSPRSAFVVGHF